MSCREGRADPEMRSAKRTTLCRALQSWFNELPYHTEMQYTFYGPWIESFQDCWWDPEFPQLSQMVQSLPGFLDLCLNVCSPCQVLRDVYTEVLEATHPLHRGPTDHKRSVGPLLSLPEVHNQLFSFAHVQRETVVLAPWRKSLSGWWSWRWTGRLSPLEVCRWGNLESSHKVKRLCRGLRV